MKKAIGDIGDQEYMIAEQPERLEDTFTPAVLDTKSVYVAPEHVLAAAIIDILASSELRALARKRGVGLGDLLREAVQDLLTKDIPSDDTVLQNLPEGTEDGGFIPPGADQYIRKVAAEVRAEEAADASSGS